MTQTETTFSPADSGFTEEEPNRIIALTRQQGVGCYGHLIAAGYENDEAREAFHERYRELVPSDMTAEEAQLLGKYIAFAAGVHAPEASMQRNRRTARQSLRRIADVSTVYGHETTARSVRQSLRCDYGLRGKISAAALWYEQDLRG